MIFNDYISSFQDLLNEDGLLTIHGQNIQFLPTKIYNSSDKFPRGTFIQAVFPQFITRIDNSECKHSLESEKLSEMVCAIT